MPTLDTSSYATLATDYWGGTTEVRYYLPDMYLQGTLRVTGQAWVPDGWYRPTDPNIVIDVTYDNTYWITLWSSQDPQAALDVSATLALGRHFSNIPVTIRVRAWESTWGCFNLNINDMGVLCTW